MVAVSNAQDVERDALVLDLRADGLTFKQIAERLGITRQRACQVWERAAVPQLTGACWCGMALPAQIGPGARLKYCSPDHAPRRPQMPRRRSGARQTRVFEACSVCGADYGEPRAVSACGDCHAAMKTRRVHYARMAEEQGGVCAICGLPETAKSRNSSVPRKMAIDHCHETGEIRGLLCMKCNVMLGAARDNPEVLRAGAAYLEARQPVERAA